MLGLDQISFGLAVAVVSAAAGITVVVGSAIGIVHYDYYYTVVIGLVLSRIVLRLLVVGVLIFHD